MAEPEDEDDRLLGALGALVREQDAALPEGDEEALHLDPAEADAMFAVVLGAMQAEPEPEEAAPEPLRFPTRRLMVGGLVVAVAAAAALFFLRGGATLPTYELTAGAGEQAQRSEAVKGERAVYAPGSRVHLVARPAQTVDGPVSARLYLWKDGNHTALEAPLRVSPQGAVKLDAQVGAGLALPPGEAELRLLIKPADLRTPDAELLEAGDPSPARVLVHPIEVRPAL